MEILGQLPSILNQLRQRGLTLEIKGCIHIGAHEGQEYPLYQHLGIQNLLFYEALPENFKKLEENTKNDPHIDIRNIALGNHKGTVEMFLEERGLSSSVLEPAYHLKQYPQIAFDKKTTVNITRLDDEEFDVSKYNFINSNFSKKSPIFLQKISQKSIERFFTNLFKKKNLINIINGCI